MDSDGDCSFRNKKFYIRISKHLSESAAIETLIHEFAHILSWGKENNHHGYRWGQAYSIVYRKFLEWNNL